MWEIILCLQKNIEQNDKVKWWGDFVLTWISAIFQLYLRGQFSAGGNPASPVGSWMIWCGETCELRLVLTNQWCYHNVPAHPTITARSKVDYNSESAEPLRRRDSNPDHLRARPMLNQLSYPAAPWETRMPKLLFGAVLSLIAFVTILSFRDWNNLGNHFEKNMK